MSIDKAIAELKASLDANTEALKALAGAGGVKTAAPAATEKPAKSAKAATAAAPEAPKHSQAEVNAILIKIKDEHGLAEAKAVYEKFKYTKMSEIKESDYDKVFDAATARYEELSAGSGGGDDL